MLKKRVQERDYRGFMVLLKALQEVEFIFKDCYGVDIIIISIGSQHAIGFLQDPIVIGSFNAMEKGILIVQAAGNYIWCDYADKNMVSGKLVLCGDPWGEEFAYENGAIGSIINVTRSQNDVFDVTLMPSLNLDT
ncbi:subtilisin-like serine protease [Trifolium pratense]|uniref:Subtilisin-like serine protease n=1 Tax=Trifolium pratense TaxID=57577 RepID=A0A2K3L5X9_TRIPR|nr:subtilisin-like serine protease [Trifolium pratense]